MGLEQVNQQAATLSSLSAAEGLDQVLRNELERETDTDNSSKIEESALKKALDGKRDKAGTQILAQLAGKLAKQINPAKLMKNLADEYSFINGQPEQSDDMVSINEAILRMSRNRQQQQQQQNLGGKAEEAAAETKAADVKEYIGAYSSMLVNGGQEAKKKMDQLENRLLKENGVSLRDLKSLKIQVANTVRSEIAQQVKEAYLKQVLAKSKSLDMLVAKKEVDGVLTFAHKKANLGGYDFGGYKGSLQGTAHESMLETRQLLRDFVDDALTGEFVKKSMGTGNEADSEKAIQELLELGSKVGYDVLSFIKNLPKLKENQGLNGIINFEYAGAGAGANNNNDQPRDQHQYQYTQVEEKEVLTDKLRALYMRRAVYGDTRTVLTTQFKMIKTKNGLIKLGVKNFDQVEKEGLACAKIKLFEMLREAFEERATYAKLSGEAWKMTERKIKTVLRNLEKLGVVLSQTELDQIRNNANEKMYREAEHELNLINTAIEARGELKYLTSKRKTVSQMLERVAEESGFQAPGHEIELSVREAC